MPAAGEPAPADRPVLRSRALASAGRDGRFLVRPGDSLRDAVPGNRLDERLDVVDALEQVAGIELRACGHTLTSSRCTARSVPRGVRADALERGEEVPGAAIRPRVE